MSFGQMHMALANDYNQIESSACYLQQNLFKGRLCECHTEEACGVLGKWLEGVFVWKTLGARPSTS